MPAAVVARGRVVPARPVVREDRPTDVRRDVVLDARVVPALVSGLVSRRRVVGAPVVNGRHHVVRTVLRGGLPARLRVMVGSVPPTVRRVGSRSVVRDRHRTPVSVRRSVLPGRVDWGEPTVMVAPGMVPLGARVARTKAEDQQGDDRGPDSKLARHGSSVRSCAAVASRTPTSAAHETRRRTVRADLHGPEQLPVPQGVRGRAGPRRREAPG